MSPDDQYTHVPGLVKADFLFSAYGNGTPITLDPIALTEVTHPFSGEKIYRWIIGGFPLPGLGYIEIKYPPGKRIWKAEFSIVDSTIGGIGGSVSVPLSVVV